jgi:hypothetical protein
MRKLLEDVASSTTNVAKMLRSFQDEARYAMQGVYLISQQVREASSGMNQAAIAVASIVAEANLKMRPALQQFGTLAVRLQQDEEFRRSLAHALEQSWEGEPTSTIVQRQLDLVEAVLDVASQESGPDRPLSDLIRTHWFALFALLLSIAMYVDQKIDARDSDAKQDRLLAGQAETSAQMQRIELALMRLQPANDPVQSQKIFVVTGDRVRVRARPEGRTVAHADKGQIVNVIDQSGRWLKVYYQTGASDLETIGWMRKDYLRRVEASD